MAKNIDEPPLDNSSNIQSKKPAEEIISTKDIDSITPNQETKNMEVHHHAHHEGKKNWKSYFWEFLMLFLAVFCGFLAEYKLEHVIENQREKKYMQLMLEDLKQDTTEINNSIERINNVLIPAHKKSTSLLFQEKNQDSIVREMYIFVPQSLALLQISFQDGTAVQLKNSGNLRLVENTQVSTELIKYWSNCSFITNKLVYGYDKTRNDSKEMFFSLFNLSNYEENSAFLPLQKSASLKLLSEDKTQLIRLGNNISNLQSQLSGPFSQNLEDIKVEASNLIKMIKTEYHLK